MSPNEPRRSRLAVALLALSAGAVMAFTAAAPAGAAAGGGEAAIAVAAHSKGRTLSGQGVELLAGTGAGSQGNKLTLPIGELNPVGQPSATSAASLTFKRGKRAVALTGIHFDLTTGTLAGKLGDEEIPVFWLGAPPKIDGSAGSISLSEGRLRLTAEAASALKDDLALERALVRKGVGMIWLGAQASPTHAPAQAVTSGGLEWGFLTSWREYIHKELGPGSVGSITTEGGATTSGNPALAGSTFNFPSAGGSYEKGLYGATDRLALKTQGSVKFAKPGHCIIEIRFANVAVTIGTGSSIVADLTYDIDRFNGKGCEDIPAVTRPAITIATLADVAPSYSANGKTISWTALPAILTEAAATPFAPAYKAGQVLDPATVTVGIG